MYTMRSLWITVIFAMVSSTVMGDAAPSTATPHAAPAAEAAPVVPYTTYTNSESYPYYDPYAMSAGAVYSYPDASTNSVLPSSQTLLQAALRIFTKVGLFLTGGLALLLVGGIFTAAVCSLTPICTITFTGFKSVNKETVRSFVTPDNISAAANFVQNAVDKYNRLQRATGI